MGEGSEQESASAARVENQASPTRPAPLGIFLWAVACLLGLLSGAVIYIDSARFQDILPNPVGPIPLAVPWFGALGAVIISLTGVFKHSRQWDSSYNYWHIARPLIGAALGMVAYLIFIGVIGATGVQATHSDTVVYDVIGFLVGYREETFRNMMKHATDMLFTTGQSKEGD